MQQHGRPIRIRDDRQEPDSILPFGMPGLHVDVFIADARVQRIAVRMKRPQVDDRDDAEVLHAAQRLVGRLGASIQGVADLEEIRESVFLERLGP